MSEWREWIWLLVFPGAICCVAGQTILATTGNVGLAYAIGMPGAACVMFALVVGAK